MNTTKPNTRQNRIAGLCLAVSSVLAAACVLTGGCSKQSNSAQPTGGVSGAPEDYLKTIKLVAATDDQRGGTATSASGVIPILPGDSRFDSCQIKINATNGLSVGFYIQQVAMVEITGATAQYKVGYSAVLPGSEGKTGVSLPQSMWLTLMEVNGKWAWHHAIYLKEPKWDAAQIKPPSDWLGKKLIKEENANPEFHLARDTLKRSGFTP